MLYKNFCKKTIDNKLKIVYNYSREIEIALYPKIKQMHLQKIVQGGKNGELKKSRE